MSSSTDFDFLKNTRFFQSIPENTMRAVLENFACRQVKSGQRFINQGEPGDRCYIIRRGTCAVKVEKKGDLHTVGRMGRGDVVGEMAILTGEPRSAHVDDLMALSDMHVEQDTPDPAGLRPDLPAALRAFILKACARKPDQRFQNVKQIIEMLQPLAGNKGAGRQQNAG